MIIIIASYVFYGWWDVRFLSLIIFSSLVDFLVGLRLDGEGNVRYRKCLLAISLLVNLGVLGFFKYYNFFIDSFAEMLQQVGLQANVPSLYVILPVGISFYTFQTLSYTIDVYRRQIPATRDAPAFFAFVSFFPQLVAGPIERGAHLLPQFHERRTFSPPQATDGLRQILWGIGKKVVVADNLAPLVNSVFSYYDSMDGLILAWGAIMFAIQIYCDFSGYSDVAIGTAKLFGVSLCPNFAYPYFSRNVVEFWRRWHISLSTWFRDYVYIPMGGSRVSPLARVRNVMLTFTVSGLWHGANWTFVIWGFLHGLFYLLHSHWAPKSQSAGIVAMHRWFPSPKELLAIGTTFLLVTITWVFFRSGSVADALGFFRVAIERPIEFGTITHGHYVVATYYILPLLLIEWIQRHQEHPLKIMHLPLVARWLVYLLIATVILEFGQFGGSEFIYFQF